MLLPGGRSEDYAVFTSAASIDFNDPPALIWGSARQGPRQAPPDMVLLHGGSPKGTELDRRQMCGRPTGTQQSLLKPDWTKHAKAAPFKRNDAMLEVLPIGVMVFPGTGIQDNLVDKARKLGIPVWRFGKAGA